MAKFSIILPVRNGGAYVKECVQSILQQTEPGFNLIVLDNSSTDGTTEWLESLSDPRIVIHRSAKSLTIEENWARIKDVPKNEFMTMIGHDDLLNPNYLQEMKGLIHKFPTATLYQTHFNYINETGQLVRPCLPMDEIQQAHEFLACQMRNTIDSTGTGYMMRSSDFDAVGGMSPAYPNLIFSDFALWITLCKKGFKATALHNCFSYRLHQSVSRTTTGMAFLNAFEKYIAFIKDCIANNAAMKMVVERNGREWLLYYCEVLSHRLLKTPISKRSLKVADLIRAFESYAAHLIPGQEFKPLARPRIRLARQFDQSALNRSFFYLFKKFQKGK